MRLRLPDIDTVRIYSYCCRPLPREDLVVSVQSKPTLIKGRGALSNPAGRFEHQSSEVVDDGWGEDPTPDTQPATQLFADKTRNIIARNQSPDVPFDQSINPYKGCEHG